MDKKEIPFWWPDQQTMVACSVISLFIITMMLLLLRPMPLTEAAGTLLTAMVGLLVAKVSTIVDFHFGTSKSSSLKDEAATTQAKTISDLSAPRMEAKLTTTETIKGN